MNSPEPRSDSPRISYRLAIASTLSAGAALLLAVVLLIIVEFFTLRSTLLDETRVKAAVIADNVSAALVFRDAQATGEIIRTLRASSIVGGLPPSMETVSPWPAIRRTLRSSRPICSASGRKTISSPAATREMLAPVKHNGERIGSLYVAVSMSALHRQLAVFALVSLSIAVLAMLVAYTLLSRVRHSVRQAEQN